MTDDLSHNNKMIQFSLGTGDNLGKSKNTKESLKKFKQRYVLPLVTGETYGEYKKSTDKRQRYLKGLAGWMMRAMVEKGQNRNRNSIMPSGIITLDIDYATPEFAEALLAGEILSQYHIMAHTTRSHSPENPRFRIIVFLENSVNRERYQAASRIVAQMADPNMEWVDKVSFRPAQMMYMPTVSKDMEQHYVFYEQPGELLNHEDEISAWETINGSADDIGNLPKTTDEDDLRETQDSAENPLEKKGMVGDFCRAYTISELVEGKDGKPGILADTYEPTEWNQGAITRMTYTDGTTSNGAVVYEDLWIYSHHGSDPAQEQLVNAYDLVRIHKFGDEDKEEAKGTDLKSLPSTKSMLAFMKGDDNFRRSQADSRYDIEAMLDDDEVDYEVDEEAISTTEEDDIEALLGVPLEAVVGTRNQRRLHKRRMAEKPLKRWIAKELQLSDDGIILTTLHNIATIIMNDPRFWRKICYNEFNYQIVITGDIKSKTKLIPTYLCKDKDNGDRWQEINDIIIRALIEGPTSQQGGSGYGIKVGKEIVHDSVVLAARVNAFHPIREFLIDCDQNATETPGCIDTVLIDYFGAEDNAYNREVSRLIMIASVARVFEPGCKFDYAPILEGPQGIGKSTGIMRLYGKEYFGEIDADLKDRKAVAEQMAGRWVQELPELSSMHKAEANDAKAFMSRVRDDVRLSYERNVSDLPRQSVIWGTTNDKTYLRDATGGRRYWPILCNTNSIDVLGIMAARESIWQDAYRAYLEMRERTPENQDLPLYLRGEAADQAKALQERARKTETWETWITAITDYMDEEVTLQELIADGGHDLEAILGDAYRGHSLNAVVCRIALSEGDALRVIIGVHGNVPTTDQSNQMWEKAKGKLGELGWTYGKVRRIGGKRKRWLVRPELADGEASQGFRVLDPGQAPESSDTRIDDDYDLDNLI